MTDKKARTQVPLRKGMTVSAALATILRHNFDDMTQWEAKARSWDDLEGVHQMRVTSRRMRAALSSFRSAVPKEISRHWSEELGWVASQLGRARDLDVFIAEGLASVRERLPLPGADKLSTLAEQHRAAAYEVVRAMLDSDRYAQIKLAFPQWAETRAWEQADLAEEQRTRLDMDVAKYARKRLDRSERKVLEAGTDLDKNDARQLHRLRIQCKKLRYAAEFFSAITPGLDVYITRLKGLQDLLGVLNDVSVMSSLLDDLLAGQSDPDVIRYSGGLVGWRTRQSCELLDSFEDHWQAFVQGKHPWWHKHGHGRHQD
ncbi:CHAD domain-containing protein [Thiocapsa bogorovii]|uniref:CHAD domain-containing protein n=1 Tax=Thiocapsa bogorovii TaxID=521689 RepID=UPI001E4D9AA9|nr:CHAD domain-containing protein [Thiocapsa bogorovii]UHD16045.1 CHAD domain-containing protein [Thiocapsa bogorovii]